MNIISSPKPKAHLWAYSKGTQPLSVRPSVNIFKRLLLWSREANSYHISHITYIGGERIIVLLLATYSLCSLIMKKVETSICGCLSADILTNVLQKCFLSGSLPAIWIVSKPLNLIGCHGSRKAKFAKKKKKYLLIRSHRGMKLKLCRNVHNISLYIKCARCSCAFVLW